MSLIYTNEASDGYVTLFCPACWVSVGEYTYEEAGELARANIQPFCFECDGLIADTVPIQLIEFLDHWMLGIGNAVFLAEWLDGDKPFHRTQIRVSKISLTTYFDLKTGLGPKYALKEISQ